MELLKRGGNEIQTACRLNVTLILNLVWSLVVPAYLYFDLNRLSGNGCRYVSTATAATCWNPFQGADSALMSQHVRIGLPFINLAACDVDTFGLITM